MKITVEFFGQLTEAFGTTQMELNTTSETLIDLYRSLCLKNAVKLEHDHIKPILNDTFASWHDHIQAGDLIGFMPPASGG